MKKSKAKSQAISISKHTKALSAMVKLEKQVDELFGLFHKVVGTKAPSRPSAIDQSISLAATLDLLEPLANEMSSNINSLVKELKSRLF